jgi:hypothetical protein
MGALKAARVRRRVLVALLDIAATDCEGVVRRGGHQRRLHQDCRPWRTSSSTLSEDILRKENTEIWYRDLRVPVWIACFKKGFAGTVDDEQCIYNVQIGVLWYTPCLQSCIPTARQAAGTSGEASGCMMRSAHRSLSFCGEGPQLRFRIGRCISAVVSELCRLPRSIIDAESVSTFWQCVRVPASLSSYFVSWIYAESVSTFCDCSWVHLFFKHQ